MPTCRKIVYNLPQHLRGKEDNRSSQSSITAVSQFRLRSSTVSTRGNSPPQVKGTAPEGKMIVPSSKRVLPSLKIMPTT